MLWAALRDIKRTTTEWVRLYSKAKRAIRLAEEVQSDQMKYVNLRFLLAVQAAEVFHREIYGPAKRSLRVRIDDLVAKLRGVLGFSPDGLNEAFRAKTVRTRNYYTHFSEQSSGAVFDSADMYWASQRLAVMINILALHEIGVESATIRKRLPYRTSLIRMLKNPRLPF